MKTFITILFVIFLSPTLFTQNSASQYKLELGQASGFADIALECIRGMQTDSARQNLSPDSYNCSDWSSTMYAHWMLVKLLKEFPDLPAGKDIREAINQNITPGNVQAEIEKFNAAGYTNFEMSSGWAWTLKLSGELNGWEDNDGKIWGETLQELAKTITKEYIGYIQAIEQATRSGDESNSAFEMSLVLDYADATMNFRLKDLIENKAIDFYLSEKNCQTYARPGITNYLSPCLVEASLMSKIFPDEMFNIWIERFLPGLSSGGYPDLTKPAVVKNNNEALYTDALNLSKAWCLYNITNKLGGNSDLNNVAKNHLEKVMPAISRNDNPNSCWLAAFAVYAVYSSQAK
jgi:hypothetical protein